MIFIAGIGLGLFLALLIEGIMENNLETHKPLYELAIGLIIMAISTLCIILVK
jgi:hypothetical protein